MKQTYFAPFALSLFMGTSAQSAVVFQDDFNDDNTTGWTFSGNDANQWGVDSGKLSSSIGSDDNYEGRGYAVINGIATSNHFRLSADVSVERVSNRTPANDFGHVGFIWDFNSGTSMNTSYLRTHSNHITTWSVDPGGSGEIFLSTPGTVNQVTYAMAIEVDYINQIMEVSLNNYAMTFSGSQFTQYVANAGINSGGGIGLIQWGEEVHYDNVVLNDLTLADASIPVPGMLSLFLLRIAAIPSVRKVELCIS